MKTKTSFIEKKTSPVINKEVLKVGSYDIYEPDESDIYEPDEQECVEQFDEFLAEDLEGPLEYIGLLQELLFYSIEAENNLKVLKDSIIGKLGEEKYKKIIYVIESNIISLNQRLSKEWDSYDSLRACSNKFCSKN
jgi:hypothetical protein